MSEPVSKLTSSARLTLLALAWLSLLPAIQAQKASNWRVYRLADGLPESACISVTIAPQGKVLVKHLNLPLISELDGYSLTVMPAAAEPATGRIYGSPGGQLWTVIAGGLQEFRDGGWVMHSVPEISAEFHESQGRVVDPIPICPVKQGIVLFLLPNRLMRFNSEDPEHPRTELMRQVTQTKLEKYSAMGLGHDGGLWLSGTRGLAKAPGPLRNLRPDSEWQEFLIPDRFGIQNLQEPHEEEDHSVTAVAESSTTHQKVIAHFDGQLWTTNSVRTEKIRHAWRGPDRTSWAATIDALYFREEGRGEMLENEEISARQYFDVAVEPGGAFWLATSDGLFRYARSIWRNPIGTNRFYSVIHCLSGDPENRIWFVAGRSLHLIKDNTHHEFALDAPALPRSQSAHALFPLKDGTLLLDTGGQLLRFEPSNGSLSEVPQRRAFRPLGLMRDGSLCVHTMADDSSHADSRLELFDGSQFEPLVDLPSDLDPERHITAFFAAQNGDLWVSGRAGPASYHDKKWQTFFSNDKSTPEGVSAFVELPDSKIWAAAADKIWEYDGRSWSVLRRGFDRINAMLRGRDGSIWIATESGLHRFLQGAWVENGMEEGLPSAAVRELCEDQRGILWAATTRGLSVYEKDADTDPPRTFIQGLANDEKNILEGKLITLNFGALDKWKYTPRDRLLYSYRLDDREWSTFSEGRDVSFTDLAAGKHYFQVRAMDRNCNIDPKPAQLEFSVVLPWFRETRLVLILGAGLSLALFFAGLAFNRHRQLVRSYAEVERNIAQRTQELEIANRELLHSQKMNALGTLSAGIAHDFNNILSIIKGSAQIIEDNPDDLKKIRTRVDRIKTVVEQGAGIVKAMLGFSRDSDLQSGTLDLNGTVEDTLKLLGDRFLREIEVQFDPTPALPQVCYAKDFIQQILLNFIFNASESLSDRKQIILRTWMMQNLPSPLVLTPSQPGPCVCVSVQDFGSGIAPEILPRIFEPFFTTKAFSARRGTGLGLSMVYELAKKMNAGLAVQSVVNQGSTFTLILPLGLPQQDTSRSL